MNALLAVTVCLLVALEPVNCQRARGKLQPWMQGAIAVVVFLVLAMIALVVNRLWCQDKDDSFAEKITNMRGNKDNVIMSNGTEGSYSTAAAAFRCEEGPHIYENKIEVECHSKTECHAENHIDDVTTCM
ncbi:PDZK1-interacting protein 1 [Elgaria multicarinata webbii]|uniref:PDZK1-interacting protein 1 n=1 Tax=Elgaria multicarinata webbii TaxID=159646 RepID=UPI002FCD0CAE